MCCTLNWILGWWSATECDILCQKPRSPCILEPWTLTNNSPRFLIYSCEAYSLLSLTRFSRELRFFTSSKLRHPLQHRSILTSLDNAVHCKLVECLWVSWLTFFLITCAGIWIPTWSPSRSSAIDLAVSANLWLRFQNYTRMNYR